MHGMLLLGLSRLYDRCNTDAPKSHPLRARLRTGVPIDAITRLSVTVCAVHQSLTHMHAIDMHHAEMHTHPTSMRAHMYGIRKENHTQTRYQISAQSQSQAQAQADGDRRDAA
jgi:hypothetical protein